MAYRHTLVIKENRDFKRLYARGKFQTHPLLVTYALKNKSGCSRFGITASKKVGNAVCRNRAKRIIRAAYRQLEPQLNPGWDFIFVARTQTVQSKTPQIYEVMRRQVEGITVHGKSVSRQKQPPRPGKK